MHVIRTDGLKIFEGGGVCYQISATEPVVRVYSGARGELGFEKLSAAAKQWIFD